MYYQPARNHVVRDTAGPVSQAVNMAGTNGVLVEATCLNYAMRGANSPLTRTNQVLDIPTPAKDNGI